MATGNAAGLPFLKADGKTVITSTEALTLSEVPKSLLVVGAGSHRARIGLDLQEPRHGPLAFAELEAAAKAAGVELAYSATVCGALPVVNIGRPRDLAACDIRAVAGVFNATSNSILAAMVRGGDYADALRQAQLDGIAEADPSLDVEGWDTANKLVIIANSILRQPCTLADVQPVIGITGITPRRSGSPRGAG